MKITRQDFLKLGAGAGALVTLVLVGCGSDDDGGGGGSSGSGGSGGGSAGNGSGGSAGASTGPCSTTMTFPHGHELPIEAADLDSTTDKTYDIQGSAPHAHMVTLTAAQLAELKAGQSVVVTSSVDAGHSHELTVTCV